MLALLAQSTQPADGAISDTTWLTASVLAGALIVPFVLAVTTSFLKLVVVGHILKSALGTSGIPPPTIITGLAIVLTAHIMAPTFRQAYAVLRDQDDVGGDVSWATLAERAEAGAAPLRSFLQRHTRSGELALFVELRSAIEAGRPVTTLPASQPTTGPAATAAADDWTILVPAFVISELSEAFQIGFLLFVPFVIIDLIVANVLMSMGMFMLSPVVVSLPIKLLLFVLVDGWRLITQGLVLGYS